MTNDDSFEPRVSIFWLFRQKLIIDATRLFAAEKYGDCLTHPGSHIKYWTSLQRRGVVPKEIEYEEQPRGRVVYHTPTNRFTLYADQCVLDRPEFIQWILTQMHLPAGITDLSKDLHYRCARCLARSAKHER